MRVLSQDSGYGLIDVLVMAAIIPIVLMAMMGMTKTLARSGTAIGSRDAFDVVGDGLRLAFGSVNTCTGAFLSQTLRPAHYPRTERTVDVYQVQMGSTVIVTSGDLIQAGLRIQRMSLTDMGLAKGTTSLNGITYEIDYATFEIDAPKTSANIGTNTLTKKYFLALLVDMGSREIVTCYTGAGPTQPVGGQFFTSDPPLGGATCPTGTICASPDLAGSRYTVPAGHTLVISGVSSFSQTGTTSGGPAQCTLNGTMVPVSYTSVGFFPGYQGNPISVSATLNYVFAAGTQLTFNAPSSFSGGCHFSGYQVPASTLAGGLFFTSDPPLGGATCPTGTICASPDLAGSRYTVPAGHTLVISGVSSFSQTNTTSGGPAQCTLNGTMVPVSYSSVSHFPGSQGNPISVSATLNYVFAAGTQLTFNSPSSFSSGCHFSGYQVP